MPRQRRLAIAAVAEFPQGPGWAAPPGSAGMLPTLTSRDISMVRERRSATSA